MRKLLVVLKQEYLLRVRTRGFLFGTFIAPLLLGAMVVLPSVFMRMNVAKPALVAVVDDSGVLYEALDRSLDEKNKAGDRMYNLVLEPPRGRSRDDLVKELSARVKEETLDGFFLVSADVIEGAEVSYYARNVSDLERNQMLEQAVNKAIREVRISRSGMDQDQINAILKRSSLATFKVGEGGEARSDRGVTFLLATAVGFVFYFMLIMYGAMMLRAALDEKTSRSAELMVATVRSSTLMGGKILGIGLTGLTQIAIWAIIVSFVAAYAAGMAGGVLSSLDAGSLGLKPSMALWFGLYYILGFLLYAGLYGAIGAMVNTEAEAQQLQIWVTVPVALSFTFMFMAVREPSAAIVRIVSLFPLFTPIVMAVRICVITPPFWELLLSLVILAASIAGVIWVAGRIFRVGLLMYGKRPTLPELMKWIRYG